MKIYRKISIPKGNFGDPECTHRNCRMRGKAGELNN